MDIIKEKVSNWLSYCKDYVKDFHIVDQQKNIVYFSKFTLEPNEFYEIHNFVQTLKINIFRSLIDQFKYCVNNFLSFENQNLTEKEKVMVIYSACFLNYYKKFCFELNNTFEQYYDDDFMSLVNDVFKFEVTNEQLFKVLCFCFYDKMREIIKSLNYEKIKPLKKTYNSKINNNNNIEILIGSNGNNNDNNQNTINENNVEHTGFQEQVITYMLSVKERIVDLVFEMRYRGIFPKICANEINSMNDRLHQLGNLSAQKFHNLNIGNKNIFNINKNDNFIKPMINIDNNEKIPIPNEKSNINLNETKNTFFTDTSNSINTSFQNNSIIENNEEDKKYIIKENLDNKINYKLNINISPNSNSAFQPINQINNNINNNNINSNINNNINNNESQNNINNNDNSNRYSQRIISKVIKNEVDSNTLEIIKNVAKKIDEKYLDSLLNKSSKPIVIIKYFSCYIVEFPPKMLQNIEPNYKDVLNNFSIKFVILAKELYNTAMELFCSIHDLSYTNINTFIDLARNCGIQVKYAQGLYKLFKDYSFILLEKDSYKNLKKTVQKLCDMEKINWDNLVNQKWDEFTSILKE